MDSIDTVKLKNVELQENGIIRLAGVILARINKDIWKIGYDKNNNMTLNSQYISSSSGELIDEPLERILEETKKLTKKDFAVKEDISIKIGPKNIIPTDMEYKAEMDKLARELVEPLQNGEREEVCSICGRLLDSDSYAYGGKYPVHITCSLNARKIYIGSNDKNGKLKPSEYLEDLLSQSKKEGSIDIIQKIRMLNRQWNEDFKSKIYTKSDIFNHIENTLEDVLESLTNQSKGNCDDSIKNLVDMQTRHGEIMSRV